MIVGIAGHGSLFRLLVFLASLGCCQVFGQVPSASELQQRADLCRELLESSVVDFYLPNSIDRQNGGYLENLGRNGEFATGGGKFLTLQARQLWTFSVLAENGIRKAESLAAAKVGFDYIRSKFYDRTHGGYYNRLNDDGTARDARKHSYLNSFALYGFVAYYRASGNHAALDAAIELFEQLEKKAYDQGRGGYQEFFTEDWTPITDPSQGGIVGAVGTKTYNTHLHLLESFTELYRATKDDRVARRLAELIEINTRTVQHSKFPCNIDGWTLDWTMIDAPNNLRASYGHDVECAWLVLDAARALEWSPKILKSWAITLVDYSLEFGYDKANGGFFYTGPLGHPATDKHKEWWVQAEALVSMLEMYRLTGDAKYFQVFEQTFKFVRDHQIAKEGSWWASRNEDGSPSRNTSRTSMWQGGYHNGRALLQCAKLLDAMLEHKPKDNRLRAP